MSYGPGDDDLGLLLRAKHGELRGAIHCAQGLFEANVDCLANVMRLQRENAELRQRMEADRAGARRREEALLQMARDQQTDMASMQRMLSLGTVWGKLIDPTRLGPTSAGIDGGVGVDASRRAATVLAWLSTTCIRQAAATSSAMANASKQSSSQCSNNQKMDSVNEISGDVFSIDLFAREVADALSSAEGEIIRLSNKMSAAEEGRRRAEQTAIEAEREVEELRRAVAQLQNEASAHESRYLAQEAELRAARSDASWLRRDLQAARAEALRWRAESEQMCRTLQTLTENNNISDSNRSAPVHNDSSARTPVWGGGPHIASPSAAAFQALSSSASSSAASSSSASPSATAITPLPRYNRDQLFKASGLPASRGIGADNRGSPTATISLKTSEWPGKSEALYARDESIKPSPPTSLATDVYKVKALCSNILAAGNADILGRPGASSQHNLQLY